MKRVALVTGGNSGVGLEVCRALAAHDLTVYLGSRDQARGEAALAELGTAGDVRLVVLDVTSETDRQAALDGIEREHGRLDVLVNNAGVALSGSALAVTPETIEESFAANLHGPVRLLQMAVPLLRKGIEPRVVNVSSGAGSLAWIAADAKGFDPTVLPYSYCTAKAALNAATVLFAKALEKDGIKVNAVTPGTTSTRVSRFQGRPPSDGAKVVVEYALLEADGPTGGFFGPKGRLDW